jgi:hypothetical protein
VLVPAAVVGLIAVRAQCCYGVNALCDAAFVRHVTVSHCRNRLDTITQPTTPVFSLIDSGELAKQSSLKAPHPNHPQPSTNIECTILP